MQNIKRYAIEKFTKEISSLDFSLSISILEMKYNTIVENILEDIKVKKEKLPQNQTTTDLDVDSLINETPSIQQTNPLKTTTTQSGQLISIPDNFVLTNEMKQYAQSKYFKNIDELFEIFKYDHQSRGILSVNWVATWKSWISRRRANTIEKTTIPADFELTPVLKDIASKHINKKDIESEFTNFKLYYEASGTLKVSWEKAWENWCLNSKKYKPKELSKKQKEKQEYRWDFKKAQETSNKIKDWLRFEKGINWLGDYYNKGRTIKGIGWQKVMHPDFNKEEILLYKIDSPNGQVLLQHKSDDIIDVDVLNDR